MPKKAAAPPANADQWCFAWVPKVPKKSRGAVLAAAIWPKNERAISVGFLEPATTKAERTRQERVAAAARGWTAPGLANVQFIFQKDPSQCRIRISFRFKGSWSLLGTLCKNAAVNQPTMNFGWLQHDSDQVAVDRVVLHEFGHALGLIHEHQNPRGAIQWNKDKVYKDLSGPPNKWDKATIDANMFATFPKTQLIASKADKTSIMMYPFPATWTLDGTSTPLNSALSMKDRQIIAAIYP